MRRAILLLAVAAFGLSGCGKRPRYLDPPDSPDQTHIVYPKKYPPPDSPDDRL